MPNVAPFEIIAGPLQVYVAPVGSDFPDVDEEPTAPWVLLGTNGNRNYSEDGVTINHPQTVETVRTAGSTGPVKAWRTEEECHVTFTLLDLSLEQYAAALNFGSVTDTPAGPGAPGTRAIGLSRGHDVAQRALLCRGTKHSAYGDFPAQFEIPVAFEGGEPEPAFVKGEPAGLTLDFQALEDPEATDETERFGRLVMQDAEAGT